MIERNEIVPFRHDEEQIRDYYRILGVEHDASPQEIRSAWKRLTLENSPERSANESEDSITPEERRRRAQPSKKYLAIQEAYEALGDPKNREKYDLWVERVYKWEEQIAKDEVWVRSQSALSFPEVIHQLTDTTGMHIVALVGSVNHTKYVREWQDGLSEPSPEIQQKLRFLNHIVQTMSRSGESKNLIQAFLQGTHTSHSFFSEIFPEYMSPLKHEDNILMELRKKPLNRETASWIESVVSDFLEKHVPAFFSKKSQRFR